MFMQFGGSVGWLSGGQPASQPASQAISDAPATDHAEDTMHLAASKLKVIAGFFELLEKSSSLKRTKITL